MRTQQHINFERIAAAITFIKENYTSQPKLDDVAAHVNLSPHHFQRMFREWAGVSPKQFLQYLSIEHAKKCLTETRSTLLDAAIKTGLSGTGRLHDLFVNLEGMTPGDYKNGGKSLIISYSLDDTPFGKMLVASTGRGICNIAFADDGEEAAIAVLKSSFPNAHYVHNTDAFQQRALSFFYRDETPSGELKLHLKGTPFQLKIWQALLDIPSGRLTTYSDLAAKSGQPGASRAVGSAVAKNPIAVLIPCHRVIKADAQTGNYHWGPTRKQLLIGWEAAQSEQ